MGVKYFFSWFKSNYENRIKKIGNKPGIIKEKGISIDNFLIDMNGIFHNCAQKIYEYGSHKPIKNFLNKRKPRNGFGQQIRFFEEVCKYIDMLYEMVLPQKRLVLCVDGVAPISKQNQQRQRRFKASLERKEEDDFDSNCFTPGTVMMDHLCKYIDWFIRNKITTDERWREIEVVFSNEKVPGEGEHKLKNFIKRYGTDEETYMVQGMDADLIMLSLATGREHFYILREDHRSTRNEYYILDVDNFKGDIISKLYWEHKDKMFDSGLAIYDFILMCFSVGNDFLPNIPTIDILEGGLEMMFTTYKKVASSYGHFTYKKEIKKKNMNGEVVVKKRILGIEKTAYSIFLGELATKENEVLNYRMNKGTSGYEDSKLIKYSTYIDLSQQISEEKKENNSEDVKESVDGTMKGRYEVDFKKYRLAYYRKAHTKVDEVKQMCLDYVKGLTWVLNYYVEDLPSWNWNYQHHYAPFLKDLSWWIYSFTEPEWGRSQPNLPFQQLLCVLPTKSKGLIPPPLDKLFEEDSKLTEFYPTEFKIDLEGKKNDWEGVVILPFVDLVKMNEAYSEVKEGISDKDMRRNVIGKSFLYNSGENYTYKSVYGDITDCIAYINQIII